MKLNGQPLIFTNKQREKIDRSLTQLAEQASSPLVMLADISGQLITYQGRLSAAKSHGLAALAAASFAANLEMGSFLGLSPNFRQQLLESKKANLYTITVGQELLLIIVFTQQTLLGLVRLLAQQTQEDLLLLIRQAEQLRQEMQTRPQQKIDTGFGPAVQVQLDDLLS